MTCFVGLPVGDYACAGVDDGDVGSGNGRLAGISDSPLNSAAKFLCKCIGGEQGCGQEQNAFQSHGDPPKAVIAVLFDGLKRGSPGLTTAGGYHRCFPKNSRTQKACLADLNSYS